jgi:hypothetical protein
VKLKTHNTVAKGEYDFYLLAPWIFMAQCHSFTLHFMLRDRRESKIPLPKDWANSMEQNLSWDDNSGTTRHDPRATLVHPEPGNSNAHPQILLIYLIYLSSILTASAHLCLSPKLPLAFTLSH